MAVQKIVPFLWFDTQAEEAARYYVSIFPNSKIEKLTHYGPGAPMPAGSVCTAVFELEGVKIIALNGGKHYQLTPAISIVALCDTQAELDDYWAKLSAGGKEVQCGWVTDRFGLCWQIWPAILPSLLADPQKAPHVMQALWKMVKLDIGALQKAYDQA